MQMPKNEANMRLEVCQSYFSVQVRRSSSHSVRIVFFVCDHFSICRYYSMLHFLPVAGVLDDLIVSKARLAKLPNRPASLHWRALLIKVRLKLSDLSSLTLMKAIAVL